MHNSQVLSDNIGTNKNINIDNDNATKYSNKSTYNEFATLTMRWANSVSTQKGDTKIFSRQGKFYLMEADGDGGCVEIANGKYKEMKKLYERLRKETDRSKQSFYKDVDSFGLFGHGNISDNVNGGSSNDAGNSKKTENVGLRNNNTSAGNESDIRSNKGNEKVSFSLRDSDGNTLSEHQAEYFKDSKIRDEDGNLLIVYHGSNSDFTVFDRTKTRSIADIQGSFFSPWKIDAEGYGSNVKTFYLNITNPATESVAYRALHKFSGQKDAGIKAREYLESLGYDGVNNSNEEYIAFTSNQIKEISNTNSTSDPDIRYSVRNDSTFEELSKERLRISNELNDVNKQLRDIKNSDEYHKRVDALTESFRNGNNVDVDEYKKWEESNERRLL